jgi:hypothetical protein
MQFVESQQQTSFLIGIIVIVSEPSSKLMTFTHFNKESIS